MRERMLVAVVAVVVAAVPLAAQETHRGHLRDCETCWHGYQFSLPAPDQTSPANRIVTTGVMASWDQETVDMGVSMRCKMSETDPWPEGFATRGWGDDNFLILSVGTFDKWCQLALFVFGGNTDYRAIIAGQNVTLVSRGGSGALTTAQALENIAFEDEAMRIRRARMMGR